MAKQSDAGTKVPAISPYLVAAVAVATGPRRPTPLGDLAVYYDAHALLQMAALAAPRNRAKGA